ncbi:MAG: CHAT domain-containing protein, partial [Bacteroidetes bacterium]|nr:CHAT domain-containing protein [Bacteroidota bacterium]
LSGFNRSQVSYIINRIDRTIESKTSLQDEYRMLGFKQWTNLGGSLAEVRRIAEIVPGTDTLTGRNVTETAIKKMSDNQELANYKAIHFSTHGMAVPDIPRLSAIVLSQLSDSALQGIEDGYMRMDEIALLDLKADFVNLSACETGLGKIYSSEGVVNLAHSFMAAGANGVSVSLWEVADRSTAKFMIEVYRLVEEEKYGYVRAISEVKRRFITGKYSGSWTRPFFWAPFVYYGL